MTTTTPLWRSPAFIIACACLIGIISFGARAGFGLMLQPISDSFGWGRETFAMSLAIQNLLWGIGQPFAGAIADKYGSGRVLATGGLVYAAGVFLMAYSSTPLSMHMTAGVMIGLGISAGSFTIVLAGMTRIVAPKYRSLALGLGMASGSFGQFTLVPAGQAILNATDWQTTVMVLSAIVLLIVPLAAIVRSKGADSADEAPQTVRAALREAFRHPSYIMLTIGFFVCGFHVAFIQVHLPAFLRDNNMPGWLAGWSLGAIGFFNIFGSFAAGYIGGRWSKKYALSLIYVSRALLMLPLILMPLTPTLILIFSAGMGLSWLSTVPLTSGLVAQFFGLRFMSMLFGIVFLSHQLGSFLGAWLGGKLYDMTGSYDAAWWVAIALGIFSALIHWPIREEPVARLAKTA